MTDFKKEKPTIDSLISNESFQNYVLEQNAKDIEIWKKWLLDHPAYSRIAEQAASILVQFSFKKLDLYIIVIYTSNQWKKYLKIL